MAKQTGKGEAEAIGYLTRAIRHGSTLPADFEQCGSLLIHAGKLPEAADLLLQGIKIIPHDGELYRLLAVCYLSQRRSTEARQLLTRASGLFPENSAIRLLLVQSRKNISEN